MTKFGYVFMIRPSVQRLEEKRILITHRGHPGVRGDRRYCQPIPVPFLVVQGGVSGDIGLPVQRSWRVVKTGSWMPTAGEIRLDILAQTTGIDYRVDRAKSLVGGESNSLSSSSECERTFKQWNGRRQRSGVYWCQLSRFHVCVVILS